MIYKLVKNRDKARIKLSEDFTKTTLPGSKSVLRIYSTIKETNNNHNNES